MSADLLRDLIIVASAEKQEIECGNIKELIKLRQQIYGKKTQLLKPGNLDIAGKKAASSFEVKMQDMAGNPIRFNSQEYKQQLMDGMFNPCYLIVQPILNDLRGTIEKSLASHIRNGTLPSQVEARHVAEDLQRINESSAALGANSLQPPVAPRSPFAAMGFDPAQTSIASLYAGLIKTQADSEGPQAETDANEIKPQPDDSSDKPD